MSSEISNSWFNDSDDKFNCCRQFTHALFEGKYEEATKLLDKCKEYKKDKEKFPLIRFDLINYFQKVTTPNEGCSQVIHYFVEIDAHEKSVGLHTDWMKAPTPWFKQVLETYLQQLENQGITEAMRIQKLTKDLTRFIMTRKLPVDNAKEMVKMIPQFNPHKIIPMKSSQSLLQLAEVFDKKIFEYFECM